MINYNGSEYYFDINRISNFVNHSDSHKIIEREIIDSYESEDDENGNSHLNNIGKTVREVSSQGNTNMDNIKYDLVKLLINQIINHNSSDVIPFGIEICMNTLIKEKILIQG